MKNYLFFLVMVCTAEFTSCRDEAANLTIPEPVKITYGADSTGLSAEAYHDRVLGALVGSAIGDAMGASTEMWHRDDIRRKYGYITGLTAAERGQSPEGTWEHNLGAGATTDDTRWKYLVVKYLTLNKGEMGPENFARFITDYYRSVAGGLAEKEILDNPDALDGTLEKVDWIKEWARVALAFQDGPTAYGTALNRFYGGEMACAGMLYSPAFGLVAGNPEQAYTMAYDHSLFDHGYAKDITALVSAMTQMALQTSSMDSILNTTIFTDPLRYQDSRLVGRISLGISEVTRKVVREARENSITNISLSENIGIPVAPPGFPGSLEEWSQQLYIYDFLEEHERAIPFHAGEIWQILIAGLEFGRGDFLKTMQFIVNYGRDNDSVAAVAGMILGAKLGFSGLPEDLSGPVLRTSREQIGLDLEKLADEMAGLYPVKNQ